MTHKANKKAFNANILKTLESHGLIHTTRTHNDVARNSKGKLHLAMERELSAVLNKLQMDKEGPHGERMGTVRERSGNGQGTHMDFHRGPCEGTRGARGGNHGERRRYREGVGEGTGAHGANEGEEEGGRGGGPGGKSRRRGKPLNEAGI